MATYIPSYRWVLEDPTGKALGDIVNAHDRTLNTAINPMPTASFRVRLDNKFADSLLNDDLLLIIYRDSLIVFHGIIVSAEEVADEQGQRSVQANAAGAFWRYTKRLIPASRDEAGFSFDDTVSHAAAQILNPTNAESFGGVDSDYASTTFPPP